MSALSADPGPLSPAAADFREVSRPEVRTTVRDQLTFEVYARSNVITNEQAAILKDKDKALYSLDDFPNEEEKYIYVGGLKGLLGLVQQEENRARGYALTRIEDFLVGSEDSGDAGAMGSAGTSGMLERTKYLQEANGEVDLEPFFRIIRMEVTDPFRNYCMKVASGCLARILTVFPTERNLDDFIDWINVQLNKPSDQQPMKSAVSALTILLLNNDARLRFDSRTGGKGVGYLTNILTKPPSPQGNVESVNAQLLYEITFCLWTLSFCEEVRPSFLKSGTLPELCKQTTAAPREKVVRVSLATLRNLCSGEGSEEYCTEIIGCNLLKTLKNMKDRQWADPDVEEDVNFVYDSLMANYRELSSFQRWETEVLHGNLKGTPGQSIVHSEKFWRENAKELEADDFALLKRLIELLDSNNPGVISLACYDLGEFVRFYPNGKSIVKSLNAKDKVMEKIEYAREYDEGSPNQTKQEEQDQEVRRQALQCMSKIMVNQWEFMR